MPKISANELLTSDLDELIPYRANRLWHESSGARISSVNFVGRAVTRLELISYERHYDIIILKLLFVDLVEDTSANIDARFRYVYSRQFEQYYATIYCTSDFRQARRSITKKATCNETIGYILYIIHT